MSTSDTKKYSRVALTYLIISILCGVFGAVYEYFSFGVYSYFMLYAFAFPLIGGVLPGLCISLFKPEFNTWLICETLYHCAIATFTVGSIIQGVLEIYGTTNSTARWYWYAGAALLAVSFVLNLIKVFRKAVCKK